MRAAGAALVVSIVLWGCPAPEPPAPAAPSKIEPKTPKGWAHLSDKARQAAGHIPPRAQQYRPILIKNARLFWGLEAPVATFAGQIHQESAWRPRAASQYASGLAQFTPATAKWIATMDAELASQDVYNPAWAMRAMARYNRHLWDRITAVDHCSRMAMTLAAYNGGLGWINREKKVTDAHGMDPATWWGSLEKTCLRADWACKENRDYPRRILLARQYVYASWGLGTDCSHVEHG